MVEERNIIMVDAMDQDQALALLTKSLYTQTAGQEFVELAAVLEYMPLAIVQAAAYISQGAPRCSVRQYLDKFKRSWTMKADISAETGKPRTLFSPHGKFHSIILERGDHRPLTCCH
jgi:hypothetical protein